jgi:hypothetical protein
MPRIQADDAQAWAEKTKLPIEQLDAGLTDQVETLVLARLTSSFPDDVSTWVSPETTPTIAMFYVAWYYDRQYSEEQEALNDYAVLLRSQAEALMVGIADGSVLVPGAVLPTLDDVGFYPNDVSSSLQPTDTDRSLGDAKFSMNQVY